jgi:hypothetical protein
MEINCPATGPHANDSLSANAAKSWLPAPSRGNKASTDFFTESIHHHTVASLLRLHSNYFFHAVRTQKLGAYFAVDSRGLWVGLSIFTS